MKAIVALALFVCVVSASTSSLCYVTGQNGTAPTGTNTDCSYYSQTCCNSSFSVDKAILGVPLGECAYGFRGNFSTTNKTLSSLTDGSGWNISVIYMANFSTGCKEQLRLFFNGLYCSPNFDGFKVVNETNLLQERAGITTMHVCSRSINRLFVACSNEYVPAGIASRTDYNPDVGVMPCANFTEVFPTAIDLLRFFSRAGASIDGVFVPFQPLALTIDGTFNNALTNYTNSQGVVYHIPAATIQANNYSIIFNPFPYELRYDLVSTQTCFGAANNLAVPLSLLFALLTFSLVALF